MHCPLCKAQIDILDWKFKVGRKYNFCCAFNWEHYRVNFNHWGSFPKVEYENVVVYDGHRKYDITQFYDLPLGEKTEIFIYEVDAEFRVIDSKDKKVLKFAYDKKLFDFSQTNIEKVINRVKTILVFQ